MSAESLSNLQTWLACSTIGTALKPAPETVRDWIVSLEEALAATPASPQAPAPQAREVLVEFDRKLAELWGRVDQPYAHAYGWVRARWIAALTPSPAPSAAPHQGADRDAYEGAREDLLDWKRRALKAEADLKAEHETTRQLTCALRESIEPPTFMGEPVVLHQGADALREALAELVACKDLKDAMRSYRSDPYYITEADHLEAQYDQRQPLAWAAARAALAQHRAPQRGEQHE